MILKRILTLTVVFSIIVSNSYSPKYAIGDPVVNNISTESIFSPLLNIEKKDIAMLEYVFETAILSGKLDPMKEETARTNTFYGVDLSSEDTMAQFHFDKSDKADKNNIRIIPCSISKKIIPKQYWCAVQATNDDEVYFQFFTESEKNTQGFEKHLKHMRYLERVERSIINTAKDSEKDQDEKIRNAIKDNDFIPITVSNAHKAMSFVVYDFLSILGCRNLINDFRQLLNKGGIKIILGSRPDTRIETPHAGGRGIYLPNRKKYINAETIIHELFAKAGLEHSDNMQLQDLCKRFIKGNLNLPKMTESEKNLVSRVKDISFLPDMTDIIDKRDYSADKKGQPTYLKRIMKNISAVIRRKDRRIADSYNAYTEELNIRARLEKNLNIEKAARTIFEEFARMPDPDYDDILQRMGTALQVDRSVMYLFSKNKKELERRAIWQDPKSLIGEELFTEKIKAAELAWSLGKMEEASILVIDKLSGFPYRARKDQAFFTKNKTGSIIMVPIRGENNHCIGFIAVERVAATKKIAFKDANTIRVIASTISDTIERENSRTQIKEKKEAAETLLHISTLITEMKDVDNLLKEVLSFLCTKKGIDCGGIYLFDNAGGLRLNRNAVGLSPDFQKAAQYYAPDSPQVKMVKTGEPKFLSYLGFLEEERIDDFDKIREKEGIKSIAVLPLIHDGVVIGTINLASKQYYEIDRAFKPVLIGIARQLSAGLAGRRTEEQLKKEQELLRLAVDGADEGIWQLDIATKTFTYRGNVAKLLGYTFDELIPDLASWFAIVHKEDKDELKRLFQECIEGEKDVFSCEFRMMKKTGKWNWFKAKGTVYKDAKTGKVSHVTGTIIDVDARHRAEDLAKQGEKYYKKILNASPIGIAVVDSDGNIKFNNPAFSGMLVSDTSYTFKGKNVFSFLDIDSKKKGWMLNGEAISYGTILNPDKIADHLSIHKENREEMFVECKVTPLGGKDGSYNEYLIHLQDITNLKKYEIELKAAYKKLQDQAKEIIETRISLEKNKMASELAHEINNVTANVISLADDLFDRDEAGEEVSVEEYSRVLQLVRIESERISNITYRILGAARATSLGKVPCSVEQLLMDIIVLKKKKIENFGIKVEFDLNKKPSIVIANKGRLQQAFDNIIKNAISFMENSEVKILTLKTELISNEDGADFVKISFKDTGPGIKAENIDGIWDPFKSIRSDNRGTGIGLSEVKAVAKEHFGRVDVESEYGSGTTFSIYLPVNQVDEGFVEKFVGQVDGRMFRKLWHDYNNRISILNFLWEQQSFIKKAKASEYVMEAYKKCGLAGKEIGALVNEAQQLNIFRMDSQPEIKTIIKNRPDILNDILTFDTDKMPEGELMENIVFLEKYMKAVQTLFIPEEDISRFGISLPAYIKERSDVVRRKIAAEAQMLGKIFNSFLSSRINPDITGSFDELKHQIKSQNLSIRRISREVDFLLEKEDRLKRLDKIYAIMAKLKPVLGLLMANQGSPTDKGKNFLKMGYDNVLAGLGEERKVYVKTEITEALEKFRQSDIALHDSDIVIEKLQLLSGFSEKFIIPGERMRFISVIYELLRIGFTKEDFLIMGENTNKKITLKLEKDRQSGEMIISLVSNYFQFKEDMLAKIEGPNGREIQRILDYSSNEDSPIANMSRMLEVFSGRMVVENIKNGSVVRLFIPGLDLSEVKDGKIVLKEDKIDEDIYGENFTRFPKKHFEGRPNIILAEDEVFQRINVRRILEKEEINIYSSRNIKEAYELVVEMETNGINIDMGIFDITMPADVERKMSSGLELAEKLKTIGYTFPVIITTGQAISSSDKFGFEPELRKKGVFQECLSKPIDKRELKTALRDFLGEKFEKGAVKKTGSTNLSELSKKVILVYGREQSDFERVLLRIGLSREENTIIYANDKDSLELELNKGGIDLIIDTTGGEVKRILSQIYENLSEAPQIFDFISEEADQIKLMNTLASIGA